MRGRKIPACFWIAERQLKSVLCRLDYWIIIIVIAAFFSVVLPETREILATDGEKLDIWSVFPLLLKSSDIVLVVFTGGLFVASDVPEFSPCIQMQALRTDRAVWYAAQWVYMVAVLVLYYLCIFLAAVFFLFPQIELSFGWGALAGFSSFFLAVLLSVFFAGVCCVCNLLSVHAGTGILIDSVFIFLYLLHDRGGLSLGILSPMEMLAGYAGAGCVAYYIILITVCAAAGFVGLSKADIRAEL